MTDSDRYWEWMARLGLATTWAMLLAVICLAFVITWAMAWHYGNLGWKFYQVGHTAGEASCAIPSPRLDPPL